MANGQSDQMGLNRIAVVSIRPKEMKVENHDWIGIHVHRPIRMKSGKLIRASAQSKLLIDICHHRNWFEKSFENLSKSISNIINTVPSCGATQTQLCDSLQIIDTFQYMLFNCLLTKCCANTKSQLFHYVIIMCDVSLFIVVYRRSPHQPFSLSRSVSLLMSPTLSLLSFPFPFPTRVPVTAVVMLVFANIQSVSRRRPHCHRWFKIKWKQFT